MGEEMEGGGSNGRNMHASLWWDLCMIRFRFYEIK